ncbi:MAG: ABC transporter ATP-binding protein [Planctomycetaceae bacterium]|nr:ABC transporter ATP-binding protein [Planctomycetaceae bacterium]
MPNEPVISLNDVMFSYGGPPVLEDVSFSIAARQAVCVVGPNGGGKTTLIKLILGLLTPQHGEVLLFGEPPRRSRQRIGYMPQHAQYDPLFPVSVMDIVLMGRLGQRGLSGLTGWHGRADRQAAIDALDEVGMKDFGRQPFAALSGGQRQRVLIARALCCKPDLLLLDEPTSNVDSLVEARLLELLRELNQRMTIVMVSHDLGFVSGFVESVICVNRRVVVHPTSQVSGQVIHDLYGGEVRMVHHDEFSHLGPIHD